MATKADNVRLEAVTAGNRAAVATLRLRDDQRDFVASNAASLREADRDPSARPRAIYAGGHLVGFLMYDVPDDGEWGEATIYRFMIDRAEQGKGYGRAALEQALAEIRALPRITRIEICYMPGNATARQFYRSVGFVEVGLDEDGEMIAHLDIRPPGPEA